MRPFILMLASLSIIFPSILGVVPVCENYTCSGLVGEECSKMDVINGVTTFHLSPCNDSKICSIHFASKPDLCSINSTQASRYPGEICKDNVDCFSGKCEGKLCVGVEFNGSCSEDLDCGPGLYCNDTGVCDLTKNATENCTRIEECTPSAICNLGKCVQIGSLLLNDSATAPAACASFYVENGKCSSGPKLVRGLNDSKTGPIKCPGMCKYMKSNDIDSYEMPCQCGMTELGLSFCNPGKGESDIHLVRFRFAIV